MESGGDEEIVGRVPRLGVLSRSPAEGGEGGQIVDDSLAKERRMADLLDSIKGRLARKP